MRAQHHWGRWNQFQKFGLLGHIIFILSSEVKNFGNIVKDKLYENWKKFLEIEKKIGKNMGKISLTYLRIREGILRNFQPMLRDFVFYLILTKKKNLQNCYEIFSQFLQNLLESSVPFLEFSKILRIPKFFHKCSNISLKLEQYFF